MSKKRPDKMLVCAEYIVFRIVVAIVRLMSVKWAYKTADVVSFFLFRLDRRHAGRAVKHILHSGIRTDHADAVKLARENLRHMAYVAVEIIKFDQVITPENLHEYISVADDPVTQRMMNRKTTCQIILTTAHLGNWELAGSAHAFLTGIPMTSIMRPLDNYLIGGYFYRRRSYFQHETISKKAGLRPILRAHKKGRNIAIVADQHASHEDGGVEVTFFGHPARCHATPALLHLRTGTPIAMPYMYRTSPDFHFQICCPEPIVYKPTGDKKTDVLNICQQYTSVIEAEVRQHPEQWLWSHRRWLDCGRGPWPRPVESSNQHT